MKIPSKVIIAGVEIDIEIQDKSHFNCGNPQSALDGDYSHAFYRIRIFKNAVFLDDTEAVTVKQRDTERTFFHEMWHCYIHFLNEDTKLNSELYATIFSNVCNMNIQRHNIYNELMKKALEEIRKKGLLIISDIQAKRLFWIIENTKIVE